MTFAALFILAIGLSMDAFAVSICIGLSLEKAGPRESITAGLYFGVFQAVMPLIGYFAATAFADRIVAYDHWIAFGLLVFLGAKMIVDSFKADGRSDCKAYSLRPAKMFPLAVATSIDALAVGVSLAFLHVDIVPAVLFIGIVTFAISMAGVRIGGVFGSGFKSKAQLAGGVILILIGLKILLEHI